MPESHLVLVLEPSHIHALSLETTFKQERVCNPVRVLRNDYELRCYLEGAGVYSDRELFPLPSLLLFDFSDSLAAINILEWLGENGYLDWFPAMGSAIIMQTLFCRWVSTKA